MDGGGSKKNYTNLELMKWLKTVNNLNRGSKKSGRFIFKFTKVRNERDFLAQTKSYYKRKEGNKQNMHLMIYKSIQSLSF